MASFVLARHRAGCHLVVLALVYFPNSGIPHLPKGTIPLLYNADGPPFGDVYPPDAGADDVPWVVPKHSRTQVVRAGETLVSPDTSDEGRDRRA